MNDTDFTNLMDLLRRIETQLQIIAARLPATTSTSSATVGWTCQVCHQFVGTGQFHTCAGYRP